MIVIKKSKSAEPPTKTFAEVFEEIEKGLAKIDYHVSDRRLHSVDSHLRLCIRVMGYRVRETPENRADIKILSEQCQLALKALKGEVPPEKHENLALYVQATLSNVEAEVAEQLAKTAEVPEAEKPMVPPV